MNNVMMFAALLAALAVFGVLVLGILSMARGGEFNRKYGNKLMQARVWLQGLALALLALVFFASQN